MNKLRNTCLAAVVTISMAINSNDANSADRDSAKTISFKPNISGDFIERNGVRQELLPFFKVKKPSVTLNPYKIVIQREDETVVIAWNALSAQ